MFDEARREHATLRNPTAQGGQNEHPSHPEAGYWLWGRSLRHTALTFYVAQVMVVAAAGNSAASWSYDPVRTCSWYYDPVTTFDKLLVGSTTDNDYASSFSNYGACVHVQVSTPRPCPPRAHPPACSPASDRPPPAHPLPHGGPPPRVCAGPRLRHPGSVGWLKQHRHQHHQRHQHGNATCLGRRRPAARGGPDALGGASQGDNPRRRGGGLHRPFCKRNSTANAQPLPHWRRRNQAFPKPPVTSAVAAYAATLANVAAGASYGDHWRWLCNEPTGWAAVRAEHWVRCHALLQ